ncbi:hypothetical protein [Evansella tamaricis]|uniref:Uncharacterized protein n=1 Tax=Evansella tamaricis TaxID=2069301 RepID=A0ABS6JHZ6_9BACI|nr:hypothetical protein [Evansella tamaricis]MBU9713294.1 hypothetical protein [Evansella tamaricis]
MGYIPPVNDPQTILYGNRLSGTSRNISPSFPVQNITLYESLYHLKKPYRIKGDRRKKHSPAIADKLDNQLSGKGKYMDNRI